MTNVLVIDDSIYTGNAIKILLESAGINVVYESESIKGLSHLKDNDFDLIILDLMMPKISGFELFDAISNDEESKKIPIIILTARIDKVSWDETFKKKLRPFDKLMRKPFDNNELLDTVKQIVAANTGR